ncbi:c-type cytochrome domain-containing protein [Neorhodopirellula lusitana]|uniref:c-type cytochrome domain-containing protein n=1 Tax=Neorhodopirellula lusitana TaxID=445327 RepID=UPI0038518203
MNNQILPSASSVLRECLKLSGVLLVVLVLGQADNRRAAASEVSEADPNQLAKSAIHVLRERCHRCHGVEFKIETMNVLDRDTLVDRVKKRGDNADVGVVVPGDPDQSLLWQVISDDQMPPKNPLGEEEKQMIRQWIEAGAAWEADPSRTFVSDEDVLKRIARHLFDIRKEERRFQRYFTLHHIYNNQGVTQRDLKIYRAALSKAVNSMSSQATIILPVAIDEAKTIFNIDLRHYGWQEFGTWEAVLKAYPFGLKPQSSIEALEIYEKIEELYGSANFDGVTAIRADWFVANAMRPPLYHKLTGIPDHLDKLLERAGVDVEENFRLNTSRRAGLFESGVSGQNRLIEYHSSTNGTLWISYDFDRNEGRGNLARFPLGPVFDENPFTNETFSHAGGEIIFNLPNGLHAYMLVDGEGNRIDEGPVNIVWDSLNISGSPLIVNGLSCISCHKHGMLNFTDFVRDGTAVQTPRARRKVQELFPPQEQLDQALETSRQKYLQQLWRTIAADLELGDTDRDALLRYEEPISRVTQLYAKNLSLETAACELGIEKPELLKNQVFTGRLVELGLGPLALPGGTIKRAFWDSAETTSSVFQEAASSLRIGTPISN